MENKDIIEELMNEKPEEIIDDKISLLYKEYSELQDTEILEDEYEEIMNTKLPIVDIIDQLIKYGRFVNFSTKFMKIHNN